MAGVKNSLSQEYRNQVRVFVLVDYVGRKLCPDVLFKSKGWLTAGMQLCKRLELEQPRMCRFENQRKILCPSIGITNYNVFYMTLFTGIVEVIFGGDNKSQVVIREI